MHRSAITNFAPTTNQSKTMKPTPFTLLVIVSGLLFGLELPVSSQSTVAAASPPPFAPAQRSMADLEKLAEPIALYPDPLLAVLLPAAVYPLEVVQAARFVKDTNNIAKLDGQPWDENVKALARFPAAIARMDADLDWTSQLGQAFIDQPKELMEAIQSLRSKAQKAGTLQTTPQQVIYVTNNIIEIQPANPQVIYVPTYTTTVYYPPPAYVYNPYAPLVTFGAGVAMGIIIANNCDWHGGGVWYGGGYYHHGDVDIDIDHNYNVNRPDRPNRPADGSRPTQKWQPDQNRMRASATPATAQSREARGWGGATTQPAQRPAQRPTTGAGAVTPGQQPSYNWSQKPAAGTQPARTPGVGQQPAPAQRPATPSASTRPTTTWQQPSSTRPAQQPGVSTRPAQQPSFNRASQNSSAFNGIQSGGSARNFSSRGAASRGGGGGARRR